MKFVLLPPQVHRRSWVGWPAPVTGPTDLSLPPAGTSSLIWKEEGNGSQKTAM